MNAAERRQNLFVAALAVSAALHIALMFVLAPRVMTNSKVSANKAARHVPVRVVEAPKPDAPTPLELFSEVGAAEEEPSAFDAPSSAPVEATGALEVKLEAIELPSAPQGVDEMKPVEAPDVVPIVPKMEIAENVSSVSRRLPAAELLSFASSETSVPVSLRPLAPAIMPPPSPRGTMAKPSAQESPVAFTAINEVLPEVDEKFVESEKAAVRELVNADTAREIAEVVQLSAATCEDAGFTYFKLKLMPRDNLPSVPKDLVILIDASGSIGSDRLNSCRAAARRILRSATNTGDRFNLVAFRDRFTYAFGSWRECDATSFRAADKWLNSLAAHGRTDVFSTIGSVLTLPRTPERPLIALVVTDGEANSGVKDNAEILSRFARLNDGLVSVYMYGVKGSANRELIEVLTRSNRGESFIYDSWKAWNAGSGLEALSEKFRDPILSDLRVVFAAEHKASVYPALLRNLYRNNSVEMVGRVSGRPKELKFALKGLSGAVAYDGFFVLNLSTAENDPRLVSEYATEAAIDRRLR